MRVLLAVDGSDCSRDAARNLRTFPIASPREVLVVSAAPALRHDEELRATAELRKSLAEMATAAAEEARGLLTGAFASVGTRVMAGDPRAAILGAAEEWKADLIVMGARGLGAIGGFLLGSVSVGITRHARCPVLVFKGEPSAVRHVVVGVDGSECSLAAVRFLAGLPLDAGTTVRLVGVVETPPLAVTSPDMLEGALGSSVAALTEETRRSLNDALERAAEVLRTAGVKVESIVVDGSAARALVDRCSNPKAELLVVGARGIGGFERLVLGSVSEAVLRHASCPVLVVRG